MLSAITYSSSKSHFAVPFAQSCLIWENDHGRDLAYERESEDRPVTVGGVGIGGEAPITVQSMTDTDTRDVAATVAQTLELEAEGCEIIRVAVPNMETAPHAGRDQGGDSHSAGGRHSLRLSLALEALRQKVDKLRLNPGNIGRPEQVEAVVRAAAERGVPIRIGVNSGSVPEAIRAKYEGPGVGRSRWRGRWWRRRSGT